MMGMIKDRNSKDLTEAEEIKKRWKEYREDLYEKGLNDPDNHDGMVTHPEPDVLKCEVKWALLFLSFIMPIIARNITLIYLQFSSLSHSVVFLYFFALFIEEGILIPPCYFLKLCIQLGISSCFTLCYTSLLSLAICKQTLDQSSLPKSHPVHYNGMHQPSQVT